MFTAVLIIIVLICTGVGGPFAAIILGMSKRLIIGAITGGLMGGLSSIASGGSFFEGFEDGAFFGALTGAFFVGLGSAGQMLGSSCKVLEILGSLTKAIPVISKVSGVISLGMAGFDLLSFGIGLFDPTNPLVQFNQKLHSSKLYNAFQFGVSALAVFGGGFTQGMKNPTCFVAGTMILTATGLVAIENIRTGDVVVSTNPDTMETAEKRVVETYIREDSKLIHIAVNGEEIITTETHPFYVNKRGFVEAENLKIGDELVDVNNNILLVEDYIVEIPEESTRVYNFQVEDFHTYYVGEFGILVHNASDLYARSSFRRSARLKAESEAPRNSNGEMICPTCGKNIPKQITINTKNGPVKRIGYDLDHYPETWAQRKQMMQSKPVQPTRSEVLDCYNKDLRVQCHECNITHKFEGIKGDYAK